MATHNARSTIRLLLCSLAAAFAVSTVSCKAVGLLTKSYTVRIDETEVNERLATKLPVTQQLSGTVVTVQDGKAELRPGSDRARLTLHVRAEGERAQPRVANVVTSFRVTYDPETYQFFLADTRVESVTWEGEAHRRAPLAKGALQAVVKKLDGQPIHTIDDDSIKKQIARMVLEDVEVKNGHVVVTLSLL